MRAVIFALTLLAATTVSGANKAVTHAQIPEDLAKNYVANYADIVFAVYSDALADAKALEQNVADFTKKPSEERLASTKDAWKKARVSYSQSEVFRFYGGPIDDPEHGPEGLLNAWPLDEAYLDSVEGQANAGIINRTQDFKKITRDLLVSLNEKDGEKNISTGYHAIEFLLWGQDLSLEGPGKRPASDYVSGQGKNAERRAETLKILAKLIVQHLEVITANWTPNKKGNYADRLKNEALDESLRKIFTGVISLSIDEMAGERLTVPMEMNDPENEQSCFSDTTLRDAQSNQEGIRAVYFGTYKTIKGPGLHNIALAVDAKLAAKSEASVESATKQVSALANKALDVILATKNKKDADRRSVEKLISTFETQARAIASTGLKMGLILNIQ